MLRYQFVTAEEFHVKWAAHHPHAPCNHDKTEYLICGEGTMTEQEMNAHKEVHWIQEEEGE
ncbi:hypothetical protein [Vibrio penaeicida]|uniref:Uncharacterized protein n=1 Tax=Vibrio penaeicida TaxID=104609 RepID=A0AAV5NRK6_9VIBR|nr:hypothetical protein [Vibrio penaeicida]RTZ22275.1 hypothetical protein EKN09_14810 [Vibrio penaeicida]GLQ73266.1 hypothetical protein GCM10007932_26260 [Vibrio penaeicida]